MVGVGGRLYRRPSDKRRVRTWDLGMTLTSCSAIGGSRIANWSMCWTPTAQSGSSSPLTPWCTRSWTGRAMPTTQRDHCLSGRRFCGHSLRLYDPGSDTWRIWWASIDRPGELDPPVVGSFTDGIGTFTGPFDHHGQTLLARFRWSDTDTDEPVWRQDFSRDSGCIWAPVNWVMVHQRPPGS